MLSCQTYVPSNPVRVTYDVADAPTKYFSDIFISTPSCGELHDLLTFLERREQCFERRDLKASNLAQEISKPTIIPIGVATHSSATSRLRRRRFRG